LVILYLALAYLGAALTVAALWPFVGWLALLAMPFGGSCLVLMSAVAFFLRDRETWWLGCSRPAH